MGGAFILGGLMAAGAAAKVGAGLVQRRGAKKSYTDEMKAQQAELERRQRMGNIGFNDSEATAARERAMADLNPQAQQVQSQVRGALAGRPTSARDMFLSQMAAQQAGQQAASQAAQQVAGQDEARRAEQLGQLDQLRNAYANAQMGMAAGTAAAVGGVGDVAMKTAIGFQKPILAGSAYAAKGVSDVGAAVNTPGFKPDPVEGKNIKDWTSFGEVEG